MMEMPKTTEEQPGHFSSYNQGKIETQKLFVFTKFLLFIIKRSSALNLELITSTSEFGIIFCFPCNTLLTFLHIPV